MNTTHWLLALAGVAIVFLSYLALYNQPEPAQGATWPGSIAAIATSSFQSVTIDAAELLFATSSCSTRTIGTRGDAIKLTFSDYRGERPTINNGFPQAASTTVSYDAEQYGCGAVWVYSYGTQTVTIAETR